MKDVQIMDKIKQGEELLSLLKQHHSLDIYALYTQSVASLAKNQSELARLAFLLNKSEVLKEEDLDRQKMGLMLQVQHLMGMIRLIGKDSRYKKFNHFHYKRIEKLKAKELLKLSAQLTAYARIIGGYSLESLVDLSRKEQIRKMEESKKILEVYGLTAERINKLEDLSLSFAKSRVAQAKALKEYKLTLNGINQLLENNKKIYKDLNSFIKVYEPQDGKLMMTFQQLYLDFKGKKKG